MEISYYGANAMALNTKTAKILVDPTAGEVKVNTGKANIIVLTHEQDIKAKEGQLIIDTPGEYESKLVTFKGIAVRAHTDEEDKRSAVMYRVDIPQARIGITGHIHPKLSDEQLEALGTLDVLIIPVGGHGYTLDAESAAKVIRAIEPKVIIPTHYADKGLKYEVPQAELKEFLDEIGVPVEEEEKYKIKSDFPEQMTVITLKRTAP